MNRNDEQIPTRSPGNAGSRGSRGQGNAGAQDDGDLHERNERASEEGLLRKSDDARGGGGAGSASTRSED
jgi:hypothetical protein